MMPWQEDDKSRPVPTKVNIRGLDNFTTQEIRQFATENYSTEQLQQRVEWIDDSSANVVYNTEEAAAEALKAFSDLSECIPEQLSPFDSRKAKPLASHPDADLYVRLATAGDVKAPRAHERSRFYLMNPEHDPRERRRDYDDRRGRGGGARRPDRRRREEAVPKFEASMYDDDMGIEEPGELSSRRDSQDGYGARDQARRPPPRRENEQDLFAGKTKGRLRDRSASPVRDGDGRYGFDESQPRRREARRRSFTPPERRLAPAKAIDQPSKAGLELFPEKSRTSGLDTPATNGSSAVVFTSPPASDPKRNRELFPHKTRNSNHRRSDALNAEETAQARRESSNQPPNSPTDINSPQGSLTGAHSILHDRPANGSRGVAPQANGFSIKGSATDDAPGFSIRGASREVNPVVKELFPAKLGANGSGGRDLFEDKMKGRNNNQRRRAEDLL